MIGMIDIWLLAQGFDCGDISKDTIYKWACQRRIPSVKCGRLLKFDLQEIYNWINRNTRKEKQFD